jgi:hypothetical protein
MLVTTIARPHLQIEASSCLGGRMRNEQRRSAHFPPMRSARTICTATFGNGSRIAIKTITMEHPRMARL